MPQDILDMGEAAFENLRGTFRNSESWPLASPSDMFDVSGILHIFHFVSFLYDLFVPVPSSGSHFHGREGPAPYRFRLSILARNPLCPL